MKRLGTRIAAALAALALALAAASSLPGRGTSPWEADLARCLPRPEEELWLRIPWRHDLLEARREAALSGRPLFLWLMDGDPCGST